MKYLIFTLLLAGSTCILSSCVDNKPTGDGTDGTTEPQTVTTQEGSGSYLQPILPNTNNPKVQLLVRSPFWVAEHWVNHADNTQNFPNKGRWWQLKPDGTFVCGQWQETYSYGSWTVYNDGAKEILLFDAANDVLDMEFEMQAVSQLSDYMSWAGTGTYDMKRIAVKATSLLSMPTKAQFNVPE